MPSLGRSYWALVLALVYTSIEAARSGGGPLAWVGAVVLPLVLAEVFRRTASNPGEDPMSREAASATRAAFFGALLLVAARTGLSARPALDAAANLGAGASAVGALLALSRLPTSGGLLDAPARSRSLDAALFVGFLWGIATALPGAHALWPAPTLPFDPILIDTATTSAGLGSLLVMVAATLRLRWLRRLELGIGDRARSAFALCVAAFAVSVPAAWYDVAPPDRVLPAAVVLASISCAWASTTREATLVTRLLRGLLAVMILGAPLLIGATLLARAYPALGPAITLVSGLLAIGAGLLAQALARPLGPEQSRWLVALDRATQGALAPEPNAAIRAALVALGEIGGASNERPEIWQRDPAEVMSVDVAGYLHATRAEAPARLYELGLTEPERTLRSDVLRALEVRRPDVRGLLAWLDARNAFSATIVVDEDGPVGFILLPRGERSAPLSLEEARAARVLSDRISALLSVSAALSRSRERELLAVARADGKDDECRRLEFIIGAEAGRHRASAERLAAAARSSAYSAAARFALEGLSRLGQGAPFAALVVPPGGEAVGYAAHLHLASAREGGPFVVLDGAEREAQSAERWSDEERSPLRLADGGTLFVLGVLALPLPTQETFALALSRRAAHAPRSGILPPGVVIAVPEPLERLVAAGKLSATLARWFGDAELALPPLAERTEDLRALALDVLSRRCLELGKPPLGIEPAALRLLVEHTFPHNELELAFVLGRAAAIARGPALSASELEQAGFRSRPSPSPELTPLPIAPKRRPSRRPLRG